MTCGEAREVLFAFLDNELEAPLSIEFQRHIEHCPDCAREGEIERAIKQSLDRQLERAASNAPPDEPLLCRLVAETRDDGKRVVRVRQRRWIAATAAACVLLAAIGYWLKGTSGRHEKPDLVALVVADFEHFTQGGSKVRLASSDAPLVSAWLQEQTRLDVWVPTGETADFRLRGARKCQLAGRVAAFAIYDTNGGLATLAVTRTGDFDLHSMKLIDDNGGRYWVEQSKGLTIVACRRGDLLYTAVSRAVTPDKLIRLTSGSSYESN